MPRHERRDSLTRRWKWKRVRMRGIRGRGKNKKPTHIHALSHTITQSHTHCIHANHVLVYISELTLSTGLSCYSFLLFSKHLEPWASETWIHIWNLHPANTPRLHIFSRWKELVFWRTPNPPNANSLAYRVSLLHAIENKMTKEKERKKEKKPKWKKKKNEK